MSIKLWGNDWKEPMTIQDYVKANPSRSIEEWASLIGKWVTEVYHLTPGGKVTFGDSFGEWPTVDNVTAREAAAFRAGMGAGIHKAVDERVPLVRALRARDAYKLSKPNPFRHDCQWCGECVARMEALEDIAIAKLKEPISVDWHQ